MNRMLVLIWVVLAITAVVLYLDESPDLSENM